MSRYHIEESGVYVSGNSALILLMVLKPEVCVRDCGEQRAVLHWILCFNWFEMELSVEWLLAMDIYTSNGHGHGHDEHVCTYAI